MEEIAGLQEENEDLKQIVVDLTDEIKAQERKLELRDDQIRGLEYRLGEAHDTVSELEAEVSELESEVESLGEDGLRHRVEVQRERIMLGLDEDMTVLGFVEILEALA